MVHSKRFDPETHLQKQGWKGKGTALKPGHATRPLAVVRKKTLSGIGKDRDEAVPFWDNIFAATAASILSSTTPSANPSPSGTPRPASPTPIADVKTTSISHLSVAARVGRESARRGLYSRFFRGVTMTPTEDVDEDIASEEEVKAELADQTLAGPSSGSSSDEDPAKALKSSKSNGQEREGETKEERRARRAEKANRKAEKELKRSLKEAKRAEKAAKRAMKEELNSGKRKRVEEPASEDTVAAQEAPTKKLKNSKGKGIAE